MNVHKILCRNVHRSCGLASRANINDIAPQAENSVQNPLGKSKLLKKPKIQLLSGSGAPVSINYPNRKGIEGYDPEYPLTEIVKDIPAITKQQAELIKKEILNTGSIEKTEFLEDIGLLRHNEARAEYRFNTKEAADLWHTGCDSDWNEGFSKVQLFLTERGTCLFKGKISSEIVKDGRIERAGWASMKLEDRRALNRKKYLRHWSNFSHLLIKCRGDGRSYKVMLHAPQAIDFTWGDSFSYSLHTHGGPYWQYEKIPFSKFFHTVNGRIQDKQYRVNLEDVSSVGIVLMDRVDGDFQLEIDYIGVFNDRSHLEEFAYETYTLPVFSTHGF